MKQTIYILTITIGLLSCNNQPKQVDKTTIANTDIKTSKADNSKFYTQQDTILIATEIGDTLKYAKSDFNKIVDEHPELFQEFPEHPDKLYYRFVNSVDFGSEQGQDVYYALYAHFLKQKNGITKYIQQRKKLIEIYSRINSLFGHLQYGGTYFGHQQMRILGYAEYSIYLFPKEKNELEKTYEITKQKDLYIKSLRQLIEDENKIDFETLGKEKIIRSQKLNAIIDEIEKLVTDNFYLRRTQEFHYSNYEYY
ncbi:MAG: hypothetical protein EOO20_11540 [Chryseobacterium sp.]|nr:MAG: hypothetical protein EOO20_11540 [Chryseobacterium sp.]